MKAVIRLKALKPTRARAFIISIENSDIHQTFDLKLGDGVHDLLMKNFKDDLLVEITDGVLQKFYQTTDAQNLIIDTKNKYSLIKEVVKGKMQKKDFVVEYSKLVGCNERTARRHLKDAIDFGVVNEASHYEIEPMSTLKPQEEEESGQSGQFFFS